MQQDVNWAEEGSSGSEGEDEGADDEVGASGVEGRIRERGMRMMDTRDRVRTDMKVKIFDKRGSQMSGRRKMMGMLKAMQREDQTAALIVKGQKIQSETEVPVGIEFSQRFSENSDREGNTYMRVALEARMKLNDMKWKGTGALMEWLKEDRVMVQMDRWRTERARVVGCMLFVHPIHTWKEDYAKELSGQLGSVEYIGYARNEWMKTVGKGKDTRVPDFQVVQEKKYFGTGADRVSTTVMNVESRVEDSMYLKELMRKAMEQRKIRGVFIESGFHLTTSPKRMLAMLRTQKKYLESRVGIPLMGLGVEVMERTVEFEGKRATVKDHLKTFLGVERVEKSSQTERLGKWMILCRKDGYGTTVKKIDTEIWRFLRHWIKEGEGVEGFPHPRRANGPMIDCNHEAYLEQVEMVAGSLDEDMALQSKGTNQRKQREKDSDLGRSPGKKPRRTYAETAQSWRSVVADAMEEIPGESDMEEMSGESDVDWTSESEMEVEVEQMGRRVEAEGKGGSLERLAKEMDEKLESKLRIQQEQMGSLYRKMREETTQALEDIIDRFQDRMVEDNRKNKHELLQNVESLIGDVRHSIEQEREGNKELRDVVSQLSEEVAELKKLGGGETGLKELREEVAAMKEGMAEQRMKAGEPDEEKKVKRARPGNQRGATARPTRNVQVRTGGVPNLGNESQNNGEKLPEPCPKEEVYEKLNEEES